MRDYVRGLEQMGVVHRYGGYGERKSIAYELTPAGMALAEVASALREWLALAPRGPIELGTDEAKNALGSLVDGWNSGMVRALAARPLSQTELDVLIAQFSYPSLGRRLSAMKQAGLLEAVRARGGGTRYIVTDWLRRAMAPTAAAVSWEDRFTPNASSPVARSCLEAGFLLVVPLVAGRVNDSGSCRLAVRINGHRLDDVVGVTVEFRNGAIRKCSTRLGGRPEAWASGGAAAWLKVWMGEGEEELIEFGGRQQFATEILDSLRSAVSARSVGPRAGS
jgi:DNA-binding HxlR family transcriptional regulator